MAVTERTKKILEILDDYYGTDYRCSLDHRNAWQLLFATILSAQCTDARVNLVTKDLFVKYPDMQAFAEADLRELEQYIRSTGFYHNKAKNIIACAKMLCEKYEVPENDRKRLLGHAFTDVTNSVYGHRDLESLRASIEKIKIP